MSVSELCLDILRFVFTKPETKAHVHELIKMRGLARRTVHGEQPKLSALDSSLARPAVITAWIEQL